MASMPRPGTDDLNDSWVELHYVQHQQREGAPDVNTASSSSTDPMVIYTDSMEKLLMDAQRESRTPSRPNSNNGSSNRDSPKSPASPNSEWSNEEWRSKQDPGTDWIWDWSSRPELQQSLDNLSGKFRHPAGKVGKPHLSVRNTQVMTKTRLFSWANLPTLFLTHACTFFLGAAAVLIYFKKYCNISAIAQATTTID